MNSHVRTVDAATGKWRGILMTLGIPGECLSGKHSPCPMCGGTDRFRFDNKAGRGTYICGQCGAGDGIALAMRATGGDFAEVAARVDALLGNQAIRTDAPKQDMSEADRRAAIRELAMRSQPIAAGDVAHRYLRSRGFEGPHPSALRFAANVRDGEGGLRPCMVASVRDPQGRSVTLHRTFLRHDGDAKAEMTSPRKLMPGPMPDGSAVRLSCHGPVLGIAEGIETAMAAERLYELPVWAALTAGNLAKWTPPEGVSELHIFGDADVKYTGQAAAYRLANRLACKSSVEEIVVHIPPAIGTDWADRWQLLKRGNQ